MASLGFCHGWCQDTQGEANAICESEGRGYAHKYDCGCDFRKKPYIGTFEYACQDKVEVCDNKQKIEASLLMLIDVSGSMGDDGKLRAAKSAAIDSAKRSLKQGVEIAILAFEGDCSNPVKRKQDFTTDSAQLIRFINSLSTGGGTPLATAINFANQYMKNNQAKSSQTEMIMLLADGANDCGNISSVLNTLKASKTIFRHETIGLGIEPFSDAADQLKVVAAKTGGNYHYAKDHAQLASVFKEAIDTINLLEMLGTFGKASKQKPLSKAKGKSSQLWDDL